MCVSCLSAQVDITADLAQGKQLALTYCRGCERYLQPPKFWVNAKLESPALLTLCLKKIKGLNKVKLVDASFIWTEPHSKRLKVKLTIQKEVFNGTVLQQSFVVEFHILHEFCTSCHASYTDHTWKSSVQLRQKVDHKRTFLFLEQLILKHSAHEHCIKVKEQPDGIDFFFSHRSHSLKFLDFIGSVAPIKHRSSEELISADLKSNTQNFKYSFAAEIAPICREDIVCLPPRMSSTLGGIGPVVLCFKIGASIQLLDPTTLQTCEVNGSQYWKNPFRSLATAKQMTEYIVIDVEKLPKTNGKFQMCEVTCARSEDMGVNDDQYIVKSHMGFILKPGDSVLGYDLTNANYNDDNLPKYKQSQIPDVILVRKIYPDRTNANRYWKLKTLDKEKDDSKTKGKAQKEESQDYERFLQEIEEDKELRTAINIYKDSNKIATAKKTEKNDDDEAPEVDMDELLEDVEDIDLNDSEGEEEGDEDEEGEDESDEEEGSDN